MCFLNVNARYFGATHDAAIWEVSTIHRHLKSRYELGERNTSLIGDSGYPLQPWMMTPIPDAPPESPEGIYTLRDTSARNVVERAFGVLKNRFRCLMKHRVLHYYHNKDGQIIYACVVLHNIYRLNNITDVEESYDDGNNNIHQNELNINRPWNEVNILEEGRLIRRHLKNWFRNH
ncbi:hypothetical protein RN001_003752 [Aquatica leii]|uniref:DDE Tnp4 domain-containing protein n=1 Tax=Aquatica leii TaxID=1421715 RepID=A0AAN7PRH2_9COLE|nr:hypothetical protein RN001_003752 [Aquatica leii]